MISFTMFVISEGSLRSLSYSAGFSFSASTPPVVEFRVAGKGGDYYRTQGAYLGERYLGTVFSRYYQNRISLEQLADYLGVKVKNIPGMENLLFPKGMTA